jgi:hypothetical protein
LALRPATIVPDVTPILIHIASIAEDVAKLRIRGALAGGGRPLVGANRGAVVTRTIDTDVTHVTPDYAIVCPDVASFEGDVASVTMNVAAIVADIANVRAPVAVSAAPGGVGWRKSDDLRASRNGGYGKGRSRRSGNQSVSHVTPPSRSVKAPSNSRSRE